MLLSIQTVTFVSAGCYVIGSVQIICHSGLRHIAPNCLVPQSVAMRVQYRALSLLSALLSISDMPDQLPVSLWCRETGTRIGCAMRPGSLGSLDSTASRFISVSVAGG